MWLRRHYLRVLGWTAVRHPVLTALVVVTMTLTAPGCPAASSIVEQVESSVRQIHGVSRCRVELTWDPPWTRERMSEEVQLELGLL